ncbi:MAG TPA: M18 family aminopeptidase [Pseudomonadales bacterium]
MTQLSTVQDLLDFVYQSPTPFHAVASMRQRLLAAGFELLPEQQAWQMQPGGRYLVTRNDSSIIAFIYGHDDVREQGIRMVGAHTDSPCLKVKPNPDIFSNQYWQLGVEVYGGVLLNPWFDRELGLAGRVSLLDGQGQLQHRLLHLDRAVGMIPSLAIHLDKEANSSRSVNAQKDLPVLMARQTEPRQKLAELLLAELRQQHQDLQDARLLDYELSFYDRQPGAIYGANNEFVASARLDNLLSCFCGLQALLAADGRQHALLVCNDHEEVGSGSAAGAEGPMLQQFLQRLLPAPEDYARAISRSWFVSADNAHAIHPNFADKHDANHGPLMNAGPVIKINANQRYASNSESQAFFRALCMQADVPVQSFVVRSDMGCGSTIGPITATGLGIRTVDIGVPTLAMHSIRETAGCADIDSLCRVLAAYYCRA